MPSYYKVVIPAADFSYPTNIGFIFEGSEYVSRIVVSRPTPPKDFELVFEYYTSSTSEVVMYFAGRKYPALGYIPSFHYIYYTYYDPKHLSQDLKACGFDSHSFPEIADKIDYRELGEFEKALANVRARKNKADAMPTTTAAVPAPYPYYGSGQASSPKATPWWVPAGLRRGELTLITAKENCGKSTFKGD